MRKYTLIKLCTVAFLLFIKTSTCLRSLKDSSRPKSKCQKNATYSSSQQTTELSNYYHPRCIALNHPYYCLDIKLPYNFTTLPEYVPDFNFKSIEEVQSYLHRWQGAKKLPKCWPILQVALCSILMPQCDEDFLTGKTLRVYKANVDICNDLIGKDECKFIETHFDWSSLFNCNDTNLYAKNCTNELRDLKFSSLQPVCQYPLVPSNDENTWFKDIGGCALHCKFPISSTQNQYYIHLFIRALCLIGLTSTSLAIILFRANKASSKVSRMARVIKQCNMCQFLFYVGWSLQIFLNSDIACSPNGSSLYGLPLVADSCVLSFILTYLPSLSSLFWCAHLGKLCHEKLIGNGQKPSDDTDLDRTLTVLNYGIPLTLFVSVAFLGHIDGHGLYGICTVGQQSIIIKSVFLFCPLIIGTIYGNFYFFRIIFRLALVKSKKPSLKRNFARILTLAALSIMQVIFAIANYFYELANRDRWTESIDRFIGCSLNLNHDPGSEVRHECNIDTEPIVHLYYLELFSTLAIGIVIASWACCESNYRGLRSKIIDLLEDERQKQRRARNYLNLPESVLATTNGRLMSEARNAENDETYHDLIDMTSPTHAVDEQAIGFDIIKTNDSKKWRHQDPETPPSLASSSLSLACNTDTGNNFNMGHYIPGLMRHNSHQNKVFKSSRDVVNECRLTNQQFSMSNGQEQPVQDPQLTHFFYTMMRDMCQKFNPPDLSELQSDPINQPSFSHGVCTLESNVK